MVLTALVIGTDTVSWSKFVKYLGVYLGVRTLKRGTVNRWTINRTDTITQSCGHLIASLNRGHIIAYDTIDKLQ